MIFEGLQIPDKGFRAIVIDPPWTYKARSEKGNARKVPYRTMTAGQIAALPVASLAARDCWLFMWTTGANLHHAMRIMQEGWGFAYSSVAFVWIKTTPKAPGLFWDLRSFHIGMGHTTRKNAEYCLLGRRGKPRRESKKVSELIIAPRREHSRKPAESYERIRQFCVGPYADIFSRESRPDFSSWGDQAGMFDRRGP